MKLHLKKLELAFKKAKEVIVFKDFNYFHGQMGAGKSTIARLIDFNLGGDLGEHEMTPALQCEFVSACLTLQIEKSSLVLRRDCGSNQLRANWEVDDEQYEVIIPARVADGEVISGTGIEILSDLIFHLAGKTPPKVRRSKQKKESDLIRLSIRNLLWYCYLDQDSMDSSFFHLERGSDNWKRLQSRDVLRFLVGFYQERVSELEVKLEIKRAERLKCEAGADAIREALNSAEIATHVELAAIRVELENKIKIAENSIAEARDEVKGLRPHAMNELKEKARTMSSQLAELEDAAIGLKETMAKDRTHKNELLALSTRFRRSQSAREVLGGVDFKTCPRCAKQLPQRDENICPVCGQVHGEEPSGVFDEKAAEKDLDARVTELSELIDRHQSQLRKNDRYLRELRDAKDLVDAEYTRVSVEYDSAYLSIALESEKQLAALRQQLVDLRRIDVLVEKIGELTERVSALLVEEQAINSKLKDAREKAEKDTHNLSRLKELFLDCLIRSKLAGFYTDDVVEMEPPYFLPEVTSAVLGDLAVTSYSNLGSGGKKTIFKCCFAIAAHRLAVELNALLPTFLIIDSPMKNISERENREQFEGFFEMLYDLSSSELKGTQFVLIDKELCSPPDDFEPTFMERHMIPNERGDAPTDNLYPPLIRYYQGK